MISVEGTDPLLRSGASIYSHLVSAPPDTNPAWSGITDSVPTSLLSPFERENLIGSAQPMGRFHLGQACTGVSRKIRGPHGGNVGLDSPFTEIVLGVFAVLYETFLMRLDP